MTDFTLSDGTLVHLIGDPHLGKKFEVGVPLSRRGERERDQLAHFQKELEYDAGIIIVVGDLFDHPYVGYSVVGDASSRCAKAAQENPGRTFIVMAGNHDMPRNITNVGAFHDFDDRLRGRYPNLHILTKPEIIHDVACFPWDWSVRADQQVRDLGGSAQAAVGHWDLASFNGKDDHLSPVAELTSAYGQVPMFSGHFHVPSDYGPVRCIGSLEPYSHAEDPEGNLYVTLSRAEALLRPDLYHKNVRIRLAKGEDMPDIECLSLTFIREKETVDEGATPDYQTPTRDWSKVLSAKLAPLDERVRAFITERINVNDTEEQC